MTGRRTPLRIVLTLVVLAIGVYDRNAVLIVLGAAGAAVDVLLAVARWARRRRGEAEPDPRYELRVRMWGTALLGVAFAVAGVLTLVLGGRTVAGVILLVGGVLFAALAAVGFVVVRRGGRLP